MNSAMVRFATRASGSQVIIWNTCGMATNTSISAATPACTARSCARIESSSSISVDPAWNSSGGRPFQLPNSGDSSGLRRSWPGQ